MITMMIIIIICWLELPQISMSVKFDDALKNEVENERNGAEAQRHLMQQVLIPECLTFSRFISVFYLFVFIYYL